ncbi:MAG: amino acid ABC transporter permease [Syntrophomonas sp.]
MDISIIYDYRILLWQGFLVTIQLSVLSIILGTVLGGLTCLARVSSFRWLSWPAKFFTEIFRGNPLIMLLFMFYFGLPYLGQALIYSNPVLSANLQNLSQFMITIIVFTLYTGAYVAEIFRSGFQAIPRGQFDAANALGLNYFQMISKVILPQMLKIIYPSLVGFFIIIIKDTSLASIIGYQELVKQGQGIINITSRPFEIYIAIGLIYFIICFPLSQIVGRAERRLVA